MSRWYEGIHEERSNIIYSRIRLSRNWDECVFPSRLDEAGSRQLVERLKEGLKDAPTRDGGIFSWYALETMNGAKKAGAERTQDLKPDCGGDEPAGRALSFGG